MHNLTCIQVVTSTHTHTLKSMFHFFTIYTIWFQSSLFTLLPCDPHPHATDLWLSLKPTSALFLFQPGPLRKTRMRHILIKFPPHFRWILWPSLHTGQPDLVNIPDWFLEYGDLAFECEVEQKRQDAVTRGKYPETKVHGRNAMCVLIATFTFQPVPSSPTVGFDWSVVNYCTTSAQFTFKTDSSSRGIREQAYILPTLPGFLVQWATSLHWFCRPWHRHCTTMIQSSEH